MLTKNMNSELSKNDGGGNKTIKVQGGCSRKEKPPLPSKTCISYSEAGEWILVTNKRDISSIVSLKCLKSRGTIRHAALRLEEL